MTQSDRAIDEFWQWFQANEARIELLTETNDPFWDVALNRLKAIANGLWFEVSNHDELPREFIITAEGCVDLFPLVERIVERSPAVKSWTFIALKSPMGFDFKTTYEGIELDPKAMWFLPLENSTDRLAFGLRIGVPNHRQEDQRAISNAVLAILDTALGERVAALEIQHVEVGCLPASPQDEGYIVLPKLTRYLEWRKRKLQKL